MEQKVDIYQPWADVFEQLYSTWEAYDYSLPMIYRYIEKLPFLFPDISEEDAKLFTFKTSLKKVPGGYKPASRQTVQDWFLNAMYIGWWLVSPESMEVIPGNHPALLTRERFEKGYINMKGHTLDGIPAIPLHPARKHQARKKRETQPEALLRFLLSSPGAPSITIWDSYNICKGKRRKEVYYRFVGRKEGELYVTVYFCIKCKDLDTLVMNRLKALAQTDRQLAARIEENLSVVREQKIQECVSIDAQLEQIQANLKRLTKAA